MDSETIVILVVNLLGAALWISAALLALRQQRRYMRAEADTRREAEHYRALIRERFGDVE